MTKTVLIFLTVALASGCGARRAPEAIGDPDMPRVGWVIMYGHDNPDEEFGCQSNPRSDCSVRASTPASRTLSEVHLYFHPTKADTTYTGTFRVGFFNDAATSPGVKPQLLVKPGVVGNHSVVGIVTDKPGRYTLSVDITAVRQGGSEQHLREEIPVVVE